jgi:hypothetical protein
MILPPTFEEFVKAGLDLFDEGASPELSEVTS